MDKYSSFIEALQSDSYNNHKSLLHKKSGWGSLVGKVLGKGAKTMAGAGDDAARGIGKLLPKSIKGGALRSAKRGLGQGLMLHGGMSGVLAASDPSKDYADYLFDPATAASMIAAPTAFRYAGKAMGAAGRGASKIPGFRRVGRTLSLADPEQIYRIKAAAAKAGKGRQGLFPTLRWAWNGSKGLGKYGDDFSKAYTSLGQKASKIGKRFGRDMREKYYRGITSKYNWGKGSHNFKNLNPQQLRNRKFMAATIGSPAATYGATAMLSPFSSLPNPTHYAMNTLNAEQPGENAIAGRWSPSIGPGAWRNKLWDENTYRSAINTVSGKFGNKPLQRI